MLSTKIKKAIRHFRVFGFKSLARIVLTKYFKVEFRDNSDGLKITNKVNHMELYKEIRFPNLVPISTYVVDANVKPRLTMITDSIEGGSLMGGVGTAIIYSIIKANSIGANLRIITRTEKGSNTDLSNFLKIYKLEIKENIYIEHLSIENKGGQIEKMKDEVFITTSWWTTWSALSSINPANIIYILQEDERMFYPFGDDRFKCEEILRNKDIKFLINSELLFKHFVSEGFNNISQRGRWFEPAFPADIYHPRPKVEKSKRKFFFYARPNNPRNLFWHGLEILNEALLRNLISKEEWEIYLVGKNVPQVILHDDYRPVILEGLTWAEYAEFIGTVDIGLSLMYTPHPSYPPLDLAASGAVVVTNKYEVKDNLNNYSNNIICSHLDINSMLLALKQAVDLLHRPGIVSQNHERSGYLRNWQSAFEVKQEK